jgi:hypothetical protein
VLGELDGMGFPLGYMLLTTASAIVDGARTESIRKFLEHLRNKGVNPKYTMTDKDAAQISAVKTVWPTTYIQICFWHLKKEVKKHLATSKEPQRLRYNVIEAHTEFSFIDLKFCPVVNQQPTQQPTQRQSRSKGATFTFCPAEHRDRILEIMTKHLHQHPLIPGMDKQYYTSTIIREAAVKEMYSYCEKRDLRWPWAYLWSEWYSPLKWVNWARCSKPEITVLKTTMIIESHWRVIKHDYLHKFNRPRIDLLIWILVERLIPRYITRYQQLTTKNQRTRIIASWRPDFKRAWKECIKKECNFVYDANTARWTCSCPAFYQSRFLICKHLVQSVRPVHENFFIEARRQRSPPFWTHASLNPIVQEHEEGNAIEVEYTDDDQSDEDVDDEIMAVIHDVERNENEIMEGFTDEENIGESWEDVSVRVERKLQQWIDLLNSQKQYKDARFFLAAEDAMTGFDRMREKCERMDRRRTMPKMWKDLDHQTMFYRARSS